MVDTADNDDLPTGPLTDAELKRLRRIIREEDRWAWAKRELRRWGGYIALLLSTVYASWDFIIRIPGAIAHIFTRGSP